MANGRSGSRRRRPQLTGPSAESFFCDASEIDGIAALMDKMGEAVRDAIRPVAQAGAVSASKLTISPTLAPLGQGALRVLMMTFMCTTP